MLSKSVQHYNTRVGEILWAWNHLHHALQSLFSRLIFPHNRAVGDAIWHSIRSDTVQRKVFKASLPHAISKSDPATNRKVIDGINQLLRAIEKLSPHRNETTHVPVIPNWTQRDYVVPDRVFDSISPTKMGEEPQLRKFLLDFRDDVQRLLQYATALSSELREPGLYHEVPQLPELKTLRRQGQPIRTKRPRSVVHGRK